MTSSSDLLQSHNWMTFRISVEVKFIVRYTPSHASDHLWQIWKESILICKHCRADTKSRAMLQQFDCKFMAEWPWRNMLRSMRATPHTAVVIFCAKYGIHPSWDCRRYKADTRDNGRIGWIRSTTLTSLREYKTSFTWIQIAKSSD